MSTQFPRALRAVCRAYPALVPPLDMDVPSAASRFFKIVRPGGGSGAYDPDETPYMEAPGRALSDRRYRGVVFVGPAQSGKTALLGEGWISHAIKCDPGDFLVVQMTQEKAREYAKQRVDRMVRNSPDLWAMRSRSARDDNIHDKQFVNGMWLRIAWPTATNLASTSYRYVFGTDYDRWKDNIDGEGSGWGMMLARIKTFMSRGKACVESSPGRDIQDPDWQPATPHEAPPVGGVLGIYNSSDRQRFYWKCPHCEERFEARPGLSLFNLPSDEELLERVRSLDIGGFAKEHARVICPHNGCVIEFDQRQAMNRGGLWLPEGVTIDRLDRIAGNPRVSDVAGFWLGGVAAAYQSWPGLISSHLQGLLQYEMAGLEDELKTSVNTGQGMPYTPRHLVEGKRVAHTARPALQTPRYHVPSWARFLVQSVDIQGGARSRFVVQVHAVGALREQALVDRYSITLSKRPGTDDALARIDPATYPEDWDVLTERVIGATYRLEDGRELKVRLTLVDTGGEKGKGPAAPGVDTATVTANAYAWFRRLRVDGLHRDVRLTKGHTPKMEHLFKMSMVGGKQGTGDIPLYLLASDKFKDMVDYGLRRELPGPGFYWFPKPKTARNPDGWLAEAFFDELKAEVRGADGTWEQVKRANEAFDLCYMNTAGIHMLGCDKRGFWDNPPDWAKPLDAGNSYVVATEQRREERAAVVETVSARRSYWREHAASL